MNHLKEKETRMVNILGLYSTNKSECYEMSMTTPQRIKVCTVPTA